MFRLNLYDKAGWSIILAFTFTFGILSGQIGFVSLAPVTKYVLIVCYDNQIGNSLIEINTKIVFKFRSIITKFADPFCHSSTLLLIGRQRSRDLFFNPFLAFYWHIFMYLVFLTLGIQNWFSYVMPNLVPVFYDFWQTLPIL